MKIIINDLEFNVCNANTFFKKLIGLMGKKEIKNGIFLNNAGSIHTFFMKSNIDIIMIDKKNRVVYYQKNVSKNKIIVKKKAKHTIELPSNSLSNIHIGDKLIIQD